MRAKAFVLILLGLVLAAVILVQAQAPLTDREVLNSEQEARPAPAAIPEAAKPRVVAAYGNLPLSFEANRGQTDGHVKFLSRGRGYTLFLTANEAVLTLRKPSADSGQSSVVSGQLQKTTDYGPRATDKLLTSSIDNHQSQIDDDSSPAPAVLRMKLVGANPAPKVTGLEELPGKSNYFIGNNPKKWRTNVPHYAKVRYEDVYPGIDLVYYGRQSERSGDPGLSAGRQLEYDFVVAPRADPKAIRLEIDAPAVAPVSSPAKGTAMETSPLQIDSNGDLVISTDAGEVRFHKPAVYQLQSSAASGQFSGAADNRPQADAVTNSQLTIQNSESVDGRYILLAENQVAFELGEYDRNLPLIIDPALVYSTYLGGTLFDFATGIAVDSSGNAYISGITTSTDFPTTDSYQPIHGGDVDGFLVKLNPVDSALVYSTYLGGTARDEAQDLAIDTSGNAYVVGSTTSSNFPVVSPFQGALGGDRDAFVAKLNATGSALVYSSYLGGSASDVAFDIAVDLAGNAFLTGETGSTDFPTTPDSLQSVFGGGVFGDGFVTKVSIDGTGLVFSTYLGGVSDDIGVGITVDISGNAYITGETRSPAFPTANPVQAVCSQGSDFCDDAFVTKLNFDGSGTVYSSFLGGTDHELGLAIAVDESGNAYVTGETSSVDFPITSEAFQTSMGGDVDAYVTKINAAGSELAYSSYLGGTAADIGRVIAVDASGNAYVTGEVSSVDFPITSGAFQTSMGGDTDVTVTKFTADGSALVYSSFLGGNSCEGSRGITVDNVGNVYLTGATCSRDFPTLDAQQPIHGGGSTDAFVAKLTGLALPVVTLSTTSLNFGSLGVGFTSDPQTVTLTNNGDAVLNITEFVSSGDFAQTNECGSSLAASANCMIHVTFTPTATGTRNGTLTITSNAPDSPHVVDLTGTGLDAPAVSLSTTNLGFGDQVINTTSAAQTVTLTNAGTATLNISSITTTGDFAQSNDCGSSVAIGASCNINVTFTPTSTGMIVDQLLITDDAPGSPHTVALSGTGTDFSIDIDIKPGSDRNPINPWSRGLIPVAVLTTGTFDAQTVSAITVRFGPAGASMADGFARLEDVDGDGDLDLLLHFQTQETGVQCDDTQAFLIGQTLDGQAIQGADSIVTVGCFRLRASGPSARTVDAGESASFPLSLVSAGLDAPLYLSCSGAPPGSTCTVSPPTITSFGDPVTATVQATVRTTGRSMGAPVNLPRLPPGGAPSAVPLQALWVLACAMLFGLAARRLGEGRRGQLAGVARGVRQHAAWGVATALLCVLLWASCGGGGGGGGTTPTPPTGTPAGTYTITVTATADGLSRSTSLTLTVN